MDKLVLLIMTHYNKWIALFCIFFIFWLHEKKAKTKTEKKRLLAAMIRNTHTVRCQKQTKFSRRIKHNQ